MKLYVNHEGQSVIDGAGNFVLSKNEAAVWIGTSVSAITIAHWAIQGCNNRIRATWEALKWIWL